jgi:hypothetical protein
MPSSSTRSTYTELNLVYLYRIAFSRLWSSGLRKDAESVTTQFAEVLDISRADLMRSLKPVYDPTKSTWAGWRGDIKHWNELQISNAKLKLSSKICAAGNAMADAGAELFKAGRKVEGEAFCESGAELWKISAEEFEEEERVKRWRDGDSDAEMDLDY